MTSTTRMTLSRWIGIGLPLLLAACGSSPDESVGQPPVGFGGPQAEKVLSFGFDSIHDRYLNDVALSDVAFDAMRGLSTIDPAITVDRPAPQRVLLRYHNERVADFPDPTDQKPASYAGQVLMVARAAAVQSQTLRAADNEKLYEAVFDSTLAKLDQFSRYAGAAEAKENRAARSGFGGIGVRYEPHEADITLIEVMPETPAAYANLQVGDHIVAIDGQSVVGLNSHDVTRLLRGPIASALTLTIRRKDSQQDTQVTLLRGLILPPTVTMALSSGIATIGISSFNQNTTHNLAETLQVAKSSPGFKGVILDLRGNPGGLLDQGVAVADLFIKQGPILTTRGRNPASVQTYEAKPGDVGEDLPVVALIDGQTASAAEIVAAALQDSGRAVVIGTNSYGKGTVQTVVRLPNDGEMTLTWSRFHAPSGYPLHGLGILPTICTADEHADPNVLLTRLTDGSSAVAGDLALWRGTTIEDEKLRKQLRHTCPGAKQGDLTLDLELGRAIIGSQALYARALAVTSAPATAAVMPAHRSGESP